MKKLITILVVVACLFWGLGCEEEYHYTESGPGDMIIADVDQGGSGVIGIGEDAASSDQDSRGSSNVVDFADQYDNNR